MRPVPVDAHSAVVDIVKAVAGNMVTFIDDIDFVACIRKLPSMHRAGETGPNNEKLGHSPILSDVRQRLNYAGDRQDQTLAQKSGFHSMLNCSNPPDRLRSICEPEQKV